MAEAPVEAVTFDLDDTLYPQAAYLAGAWAAVAAAARAAGAARGAADALHEALVVVAAEGSDKGRIIDRALAGAGLPAELAPALVAAFRAHAPSRLEPYPGVRCGLARLRARVRVGCLTDGDPAIQRAKLAALDLRDAFDAVVISDELGREHRKPHPLPFRRLLDLLGADAEHAVHVGDRPGKDVAGATGVRMRSVRVRTGEYAGVADDSGGQRPWLACADAATAISHLLRLPLRPKECVR